MQNVAEDFFPQPLSKLNVSKTSGIESPNLADSAENTVVCDVNCPVFADRDAAWSS
jgi:hypothetical protein